MTADEFWYGEPRLYTSYIKKREMELDHENFKAWQFNLYTYKALVTALGNLFSKKGSKQLTYFEKPISDFNSINEKQEENNANEKYRLATNKWAKLGRKERVIKNE